MEEPDAVKFVVTSLSTAMPVAKANVRLEGPSATMTREAGSPWRKGTTDASGIFRWSAPGNNDSFIRRIIQRIVVEKENDVLVLDTSNPPEEYFDNQWSVNRSPWLQWAYEKLTGRGPAVGGCCSHLYRASGLSSGGRGTYKGLSTQAGEGAALSGEGRLLADSPGAGRSFVEISSEDDRCGELLS